MKALWSYLRPCLAVLSLILLVCLSAIWERGICPQCWCKLVKVSDVASEYPKRMTKGWVYCPCCGYEKWR